MVNHNVHSANMDAFVSSRRRVSAGMLMRRFPLSRLEAEDLVRDYEERCWLGIPEGDSYPVMPHIYLEPAPDTWWPAQANRIPSQR